MPEMTDDQKLGYLAGLIDGEGSITLYLRKKYQSLELRVTVYNTYEPVIDWLVSNFGGNKYKVGRRLNLKHSQEWQWFICSEQAYQILKPVSELLVIKKHKAIVAIEAWENRQSVERSERIHGISNEVVRIREHYIAVFNGT